MSIADIPQLHKDTLFWLQRKETTLVQAKHKITGELVTILGFLDEVPTGGAVVYPVAILLSPEEAAGGIMKTYEMRDPEAKELTHEEVDALLAPTEGAA